MSNILIFCLTLVFYLLNELTFLQPLERIHSKLVLFFPHLETRTLLGIPEGTAATYIAKREISLDTKLSYENGYIPVVSEAYHDWSGEAAGARLRVNFTLKLLLSQNFCNRPLMRFISFASNIGPAAAVPVGPALAPLHAHLNQECHNSVWAEASPAVQQGSVNHAKKILCEHGMYIP